MRCYVTSEEAKLKDEIDTLRAKLLLLTDDANAAHVELDVLGVSRVSANEDPATGEPRELTLYGRIALLTDAKVGR